MSFFPRQRSRFRGFPIRETGSPPRRSTRCQCIYAQSRWTEGDFDDHTTSRILTRKERGEFSFGHPSSKPLQTSYRWPSSVSAYGRHSTTQSQAAIKPSNLSPTMTKAPSSSAGLYPFTTIENFSKLPIWLDEQHPKLRHQYNVAQNSPQMFPRIPHCPKQ